MREAAEGGIAYVPEVLEETEQSAAGLAAVNAAAFAGWTREGAAVDDVLHGAIVVAKQAIADGHTPHGALILGGRSLNRVIPTVIADADRGAVQVSITSTPSIGGYVRMLNGPSCKRCMVLAGRWYAWNEGFQRHPRCDCRHIPASEDRAGDWQTDPYAAFRALSRAEQDQIFGKSQARAIRDGADIFRVVNTRALRDESPSADRPRMTVDEIYRAAGTRTRAMRLLADQGYILPGGQVREGVIGYGDLGLDSKGAHFLGAGALGRGGTRIGATQAHRLAATTGRRDPLNRVTQTAAERRLAEAVLSARAVAQGRNPYSTTGRKLNAAARERAARELADELRKLRGTYRGEKFAHPTQVHRLADLLGVKY
jgi:hypothetical protein